MPHSIFLVILLLLVVDWANAAEADNFTGRSNQIAALPDSITVLDEFVNERLQAAVDETNSEGTCSRRALYLNIWKKLGRNPISVSEKFAEEDPRVKKYLVEFNQSIYGAVPTFVGEKRMPVFADLFIFSGWFSGTIRLADQVIGIDKLGHFFGQGFDYFQRGNLRAALEHGIEDEKGLDGFIGSGVFSYGDLSANRDGLRFWQQVLGGDKPYVHCTNNKFSLRRKFTFLDYTTASWDEALNCSKFVNAGFEKAVSDKLVAMRMTCPIAPSSCASMVRPACSNLTVSPACFLAAGVSIEEKATECDALLSKEDWHATNPTGLTPADLLDMGMDTLLGISAMPFHYLRRDTHDW